MALLAIADTTKWMSGPTLHLIKENLIDSILNGIRPSSFQELDESSVEKYLLLAVNNGFHSYRNLKSPWPSRGAEGRKKWHVTCYVSMSISFWWKHGTLCANVQVNRGKIVLLHLLRTMYILKELYFAAEKFLSWKTQEVLSSCYYKYIVTF